MFALTTLKLLVAAFPGEIRLESHSCLFQCMNIMIFFVVDLSIKKHSPLLTPFIPFVLVGRKESHSRVSQSIGAILYFLPHICIVAPPWAKYIAPPGFLPKGKHFLFL
ncbi:MAG: hypothetical protein CMJ52_08315 [Planctomycetaceae bacterium]|nr:hypothetical protein [Planctomycetaceae bacterium]